MKRTLILVLLFAVVSTLFAAGPAALPSDDEVRKILIERIDAQHQGVGIVVGLIDRSGRRIVSYGTFDNDKRAVDGDTLFEIGSATKVFTSLLLADAVARGEVSLDDPVAKYLPPEVKVPERGGKKITLGDLATHTSGLPRLPSNLNPKDPSNPYADYTVKQLYEFLASYELSRDIGSQYEYSNLGAGLLGHTLALRAGTDYETLVRRRVSEPLAMKSTAITLSDALQQRLAPGHDAQQKRASNWDLPTLAGAGALRSTASDLLNLLSANLGFTESPLAKAMALMVKTRRPSAMPANAGVVIALGWHVTSRGDREIVWHNGGTGGYRSFLGFDPKQRVGVVVLSNTFTDRGVDDIGVHLLDPTMPLAPAPKVRKEIAVDPKILEGYAGRYQLTPGFILTVTREGNRLFIQATGQSKVEAFAESEREFFLKVTDAQLTFNAGEGGRATGLILHQGGRDMKLTRLSGDAPAAIERKEMVLAASLLDRYVGRYQLAPNFVLTVTREGDRLFLQATGQSKNEMYAQSEREFFLKVVDAQITFVTDGGGSATRLILHQNGRDMPAARME